MTNASLAEDFINIFAVILSGVRFEMEVVQIRLYWDLQELYSKLQNNIYIFYVRSFSYILRLALQGTGRIFKPSLTRVSNKVRDDTRRNVLRMCKKYWRENDKRVRENRRR